MGLCLLFQHQSANQSQFHSVKILTTIRHLFQTTSTTQDKKMQVLKCTSFILLSKLPAQNICRTSCVPCMRHSVPKCRHVKNCATKHAMAAKVWWINLDLSGRKFCHVTTFQRDHRLGVCKEFSVIMVCLPACIDKHLLCRITHAAVLQLVLLGYCHIACKCMA